METTAYNSEFNDEESDASKINNDNVTHTVLKEMKWDCAYEHAMQNVTRSKQNHEVLAYYNKYICENPVKKPVKKPVNEPVNEPVKEPEHFNRFQGGGGGGCGGGGPMCVFLFMVSLIVMACILTHKKKLATSQPTSQPTFHPKIRF